MTRILSLDDDTPMLELIGLILDRAGYEHVRTSSSRQALFILRNEPVDVFTQDIMRPDIDGWEFYHLIKSEQVLCDIPVLIITCQAQGFDKAMGARMAPVDGYLVKPFGPQELLTAIELVLKAHAKSPPTDEDRRRARVQREMVWRRRTQLLEEVAADLANVTLNGHAALIEGRYGNYEVSLGSGRVIRLPNQPLCIVPRHSADAFVDMHLPFEDTDPNTEQILSTVLMLAADQDIHDSAILQQLEEIPHDG
jgi:DNA-binding response OmpR family regulator